MSLWKINSNDFWGQILGAWCEFSYCSPQDGDEVRAQLVWYNSNIRIQNKPYLNASFIEANVLYVEQFVNPQVGRWYSFQEFSEKYNVDISWLGYAQIINSFPKMWSAMISIDKQERVQPPCSILEKPKVPKYVYKDLITNNSVLWKYYTRWQETNIFNIEFEKYQAAFRDLYAITDNVKLRDFQYRMLLFKIPLNVDLYLWKKRDSDLCSFCNCHKEDIIHFFKECKETSRLWQNLAEFININIPELESIILNNFTDKATSMIILITKQYIYRKRCCNEKISWPSLKSEILLLRDIEIDNAKQNLNMQKCIKKWRNTLPIEQTI